MADLSNYCLNSFFFSSLLARLPKPVYRCYRTPERRIKNFYRAPRYRSSVPRYDRESMSYAYAILIDDRELLFFFSPSTINDWQSPDVTLTVRFARKFANLRYERGEKVKLRPQNTGSQPTGTRFRGNPFNIIFNLALNRLAVSASEAEKLACRAYPKAVLLYSDQ